MARHCVFYDSTAARPDESPIRLKRASKNTSHGILFMTYHDSTREKSTSFGTRLPLSVDIDGSMTLDHTRAQAYRNEDNEEPWYYEGSS